MTAPHHRRKSSGEELFLCFDGLAVAEGYVDVALAVYREVIRQGIEAVEGVYCIMKIQKGVAKNRGSKKQRLQKFRQKFRSYPGEAPAPYPAYVT